MTEQALDTKKQQSTEGTEINSLTDAHAPKSISRNHALREGVAILGACLLGSASFAGPIASPRGGNGGSTSTTSTSGAEVTNDTRQALPMQQQAAIRQKYDYQFQQLSIKHSAEHANYNRFEQHINSIYSRSVDGGFQLVGLSDNPNIQNVIAAAMQVVAQQGHQLSPERVTFLTKAVLDYQQRMEHLLLLRVANWECTWAMGAPISQDPDGSVLRQELDQAINLTGAFTHYCGMNFEQAFGIHPADRIYFHHTGMSYAQFTGHPAPGLQTTTVPGGNTHHTDLTAEQSAQDITDNIVRDIVGEPSSLNDQRSEALGRAGSRIAAPVLGRVLTNIGQPVNSVLGRELSSGFGIYNLGIASNGPLYSRQTAQKLLTQDQISTNIVNSSIKLPQ